VEERGIISLPMLYLAGKGSGIFVGEECCEEGQVKVIVSV
jgi:hypothetical protein